MMMEGLAAEAWELLDDPQTADGLRSGLLDRHGRGDPDLDRAITTSIELLSPFLKAEDGHASQRPEGTTTRRALDRGSVSELLRWTQVRPAEVDAAMAAAQCTVGRTPPLSASLSWPAINRCSRERVLPGLIEAVRAGVFEPGPSMLSQLDRMDLEVQTHAIRCEQTLLEVVEHLSELGVEHRVLKGMATAHLDFPAAHLRQIGDIDLLVDVAAHPAVVSRLKAEGFRHIVGGDPGSFALYKSNYLVGPGNIEVDLHHRLFRHGRRPTALWENGESFVLAGTTVTALGPEWRLAHAAAHAMFSGGRAGRLSMFLDPGRIASNDPELIDGALAIAGSLDLQRLVAAGIQRSCQIIGVRLDPESVASLGDRGPWRWRDAVALWAFGGQDRRVAREQLSLLGGLTPRQAAQWLAAWFRPSPDYEGGPVFKRFASKVRSRSSIP